MRQRRRSGKKDVTVYRANTHLELSEFGGCDLQGIDNSPGSRFQGFSVPLNQRHPLRRQTDKLVLLLVIVCVHAVTEVARSRNLQLLRLFTRFEHCSNETRRTNHQIMIDWIRWGVLVAPLPLYMSNHNWKISDIHLIKNLTN